MIPPRDFVVMTEDVLDAGMHVGVADFADEFDGDQPAAARWDTAPYQ
ncbi:MAG TPA: hypothetical protein VG077_10850 [Verrucomicrobiae bacterium]|nr:hypothetical protein [Verrucomicrobiae bacterium]